MSEVRIQNVRLEPHKHINIALCSAVYGIGRTRAKLICRSASVAQDVKVKDLTEDQVKAIQEAANDYKLEGDLRREVAMNKKHLRDINCHRGKCDKRGLPSRGQRTKTNARTRKGPRGKKDSKK